MNVKQMANDRYRYYATDILQYFCLYEYTYAPLYILHQIQN
jgi:hypothetical protein